MPRVKREFLDAICERIDRTLKKSGHRVYKINGGIRLALGDNDISPILSQKELQDWMFAYLKGVEDANDQRNTVSR